MKNNLFKIIFLFLFTSLIFWPVFSWAVVYPQTANYYLNPLQNSPDFISQLARYDLLILTPSQIVAQPAVVRSLKQINPQIIILAYLPMQSYNTLYWPKDIIFQHLKINDSWWLKDPVGAFTSQWPNLLNLNLDPAWTRYYVNFIAEKVLPLAGVDGVFFDMVTENISWLNGGNIDLDNNRQKDSPATADALWAERTKYFLQYARDNLNTKYLVINGSSLSTYQTYVNGRMFENFPTPWENDGSWGTIMNNWVRNKKSNQQPQIVIINSNSDNTGRQNDYKKIRFGIGSSLLEDGYFSFDYGDEDHGQLWWYDEYELDLGVPLGTAKSQNNFSNYQPDVWQRDFANALVLVNSTASKKTVSLDGEYEKVHGTQDTVTNDGSIVSSVSLSGYDGLVLLKTFSGVEDVLFRNGDFLRFFDSAGNRVRNGFFVFEAGYRGGDKIAHIDLDGNGQRDLVVVSKNRLMAWRDDGQIYMKFYPYGVNYKGELQVAIGDLNNDGYLEIYVAPEPGYPAPIKIYTRHGRQMKRDWYPFGETYSGGYSLAIGKIDNSDKGSLIIGKGKGVEPRVHIYDYQYNQIFNWLAFEKQFRGGVNVGAGDVNGDGLAEIVVGAGPGKPPLIRVFNKTGVLQSEFTAFTSFSNPGVEVLVADVNYDGRDDIISMGAGF